MLEFQQSQEKSQENLPADESLFPRETNQIVNLRSQSEKLKLEVIESLIEPCDRRTYGDKLKEAAKKLGKSVRTVQRLVKDYEKQGLAALKDTTRCDKDQHRIDKFWENFIIKTYEQNNKGSKSMNCKQVFKRVETKAEELSRADYPKLRTVYRVLEPVIETKEKKIKSRGHYGSHLFLITRNREVIPVEHSNHVWQCDHTRVDNLPVDGNGKPLPRPWLTTVIDTNSRCVIGFRLGFDSPSTEVVALALRHAILPKQYGPEYKLYCEWGTYGTPKYFYTDGGKDLARSAHLKQIGTQLGFVCELRSRPSQGGIVERPFGTFNTELFSTLPGYTGSNVKERPKDAEKDACLRLRDLEKLFVEYIVNRYNQSIDARMGDQTRFQRWEAGLIAQPELLPERELDICLMKTARRTIYKGGYVRFESGTYWGEELAGHAGKTVVLRYDSSDIKTVRVYLPHYDLRLLQKEPNTEPEPESEELLGIAKDMSDADHICLDEVRAERQRVIEAGKEAENRSSILAQVRDQDAFVATKEAERKSRKARQKTEQEQLYSKATASKGVEPEEVEPDVPEAETIPDLPQVRIWDNEDEDW